MYKNLKSNFILNCLVLLAIAFVSPSCNSGSGAAASSDEWDVEYLPANSTLGTYAALNVFSSKTGEFYQLYANDGQWKKNPNIPQIPINMKKGDLHLEYMAPTLQQLPGASVYSAKTGEWQQFYLQKGEWMVNSNFPQPAISLPKGNLRMDFVPGSQNQLAGLNVHCAKTKQFEMFYLQDGKWVINNSFPTSKSI